MGNVQQQIAPSQKKIKKSLYIWSQIKIFYSRQDGPNQEVACLEGAQNCADFVNLFFFRAQIVM